MLQDNKAESQKHFKQPKAMGELHGFGNSRVQKITSDAQGKRGKQYVEQAKKISEGDVSTANVKARK